MVTRVLLLGAAAALSAALAVAGPPSTASAQCTAAFGSLNDGMCLDQPGPAQQAGPPSFNVGGPGGPGITSSPLFPGQTFNIPLGPSGG